MFADATKVYFSFSYTQNHEAEPLLNKLVLTTFRETIYKHLKNISWITSIITFHTYITIHTKKLMYHCLISSQFSFVISV